MDANTLWLANLVLFIILELATGFTQTLSQFLAVRSLYGLAMGVSSSLNSILLSH